MTSRAFGLNRDDSAGRFNGRDKWQIAVQMSVQFGHQVGRPFARKAYLSQSPALASQSYSCTTSPKRLALVCVEDSWRCGAQLRIGQLIVSTCHDAIYFSKTPLRRPYSSLLQNWNLDGSMATSHGAIFLSTPVSVLQKELPTVMLLGPSAV